MTPEQIHHLWNLLSQSWGDKFSQQFGATPNDAWSAALGACSVQAAQHAYRELCRETPDFPPTLPQFMQAALSYRHPASVVSLPGPARAEAGSRPTEELRQMASPEVAAFSSYRDYESWRETHASKGKRPPHPTQDTADWLYLQRLALKQAAANNRRTNDQFNH